VVNHVFSKESYWYYYFDCSLFILRLIGFCVLFKSFGVASDR
jgi:hypothetical protein